MRASFFPQPPGPAHACLLYRDPAEHAEAVAAFLHEGLQNGERCVYVVDDHQPGVIYRALRRRGVQVDEAAARGAFVVRGKRETYLRSGRFDPHEMIEFLTRAADETRAAGYRALRMTGEMTWALSGEVPSETVLAYESMVDAAVPGLGVRGLCQYDARSFSAETLQAIRGRHTHAHENGVLTPRPS